MRGNVRISTSYCPTMYLSVPPICCVLIVDKDAGCMTRAVIEYPLVAFENRNRRKPCGVFATIVLWVFFLRTMFFTSTFGMVFTTISYLIFGSITTVSGFPKRLIVCSNVYTNRFVPASYINKVTSVSTGTPLILLRLIWTVVLISAFEITLLNTVLKASLVSASE